MQLCCCKENICFKPSEETASSSESERETDSSEHNGMTESMWTESETGN